MNVLKSMVLLLLALLLSAAVAQETHLRIATADLPGSMEPGLAASNTGMRVVPNVFETLIEMDWQDNSVLLPKLATSWQRIDDVTLELTLRDDVTFHNGDAFTANDVKFSFERFMDPEYPGSLARSLFTTISAVEVIDPYTVRVITESPDPILEYRLASLWGAWIVPADYYQQVGIDAFGRAPIGTGPFKVTSVETESLDLEAYDAYWAQKPNVSTVNYRIIPETATRVAALIAGEVDMISQLPPDQYGVVESAEGVGVRTTLINNMHMHVYNTWNAPMDDPKLRQALSLGIDRELLVDALWNNEAVVPRSHQYEAYGPMYNAERPLAVYDPEKAKALIAESSYNGEVLYYDTVGTYYVNELPAAEAIVQMWQDIGLNAQVRVVDASQRDLDNAAVITWSNTMRFPDPLGGLWLLWGAESGRQSEETWQPQNAFNDVGQKLVTSLDKDERYALSQELLDLWEEEAPGTVLWYPTVSFGVRDGINWEPDRLQTMDLRAARFQFAD